MTQPLRLIPFLFLTLSLSCSVAVAQGRSMGGVEAGPPDGGAGPEPLYLGIWSEIGHPSRVVQSTDPAEIVAPEPGFHLTDIEVTVLLGERWYAGLFHADGGGESVLQAGLDATQFQVEGRNQIGQGHCLKAFEAWTEEDETLYAGVWRADCSGDQLLDLDLDQMAFAEALVQRRATRHLADFEVVVEDGHLRLSGLWSPGAEEQPTWSLVGVSWDTFHENAHDLTALGYRLVDVDAEVKPRAVNSCAWHAADKGYVDGIVLSGFWRFGETEDWLGANFHWNQIDCTVQALGKGFAESVVDPEGKTLCETQPDALTELFAGTAMHLASLESYPFSLNALPFCFINHHAGILHDSGTAGEP